MDERLHLGALRRSEERDAAAAAVAREAEARRVERGAERPRQSRVEDRVEVVALDREGVPPEGVEVFDVAVRLAHAVAGEVEVDGREARLARDASRATGGSPSP